MSKKSVAVPCGSMAHEAMKAIVVHLISSFRIRRRSCFILGYQVGRNYRPFVLGRRVLDGMMNKKFDNSKEDLGNVT